MVLHVFDQFLKNRAENKIENYRPLEIMCAPAKISESILYTLIMNHVNDFMRRK